MCVLLGSSPGMKRGPGSYTLSVQVKFTNMFTVSLQIIYNKCVTLRDKTKHDVLMTNFDYTIS